MIKSLPVKSGKKLCRLIPLSFFVIFLNSCIGISMDIQMNRDGSGRLTMEYRISNLLESIGSLDGNASKPSIPVGREDWERTVERLSGVRLVSYSNKVNHNDSVVNVTLTFANPQALSAIIDSAGASRGMVLAAYNGQTGSLDLIVHKNQSSGYDQNLISLMRSFFTDYNFSLKFSASGSSLMTITDENGNAINTPSQAAAVTSGRSVSISMGIMDIFDLPDGLGLKINWQR